jgi:hypothetical protein
MTKPFIDNQELIINFVANGIWQGDGNFESHAQGLGFGNLDIGIIGGVVYHNFDPQYNSIELSCYGISNKWFTKYNLNVIFDYPYNQLGVRLIRATFDEDNDKSTRLFKSLNGNMVKIPDLFKDGGNAVIATLKRNDWLNSKFCNKELYGEKSTQSTRPNSDCGRADIKQYWNGDCTATIQ